MVVNIGKRIKVETVDFYFDRDADTPGIVRVRDRNGSHNDTINLPGRPIEAEIFIEAYRRCFQEKIEYRDIKD